MGSPSFGYHSAISYTVTKRTHCALPLTAVGDVRPGEAAGHDERLGRYLYAAEPAPALSICARETDGSAAPTEPPTLLVAQVNREGIAEVGTIVQRAYGSGSDGGHAVCEYAVRARRHLTMFVEECRIYGASGRSLAACLGLCWSGLAGPGTSWSWLSVAWEPQKGSPTTSS